MARQFAIIPFRALKDPRLHPSDKLVLLALGAHTDTNGRCWPSVATLAELSGLRDRSVQRSVVRLTAAGYVELERRAGRATIYRVVYDSPIATPDKLSPPTPRSGGGDRGVTHNESLNGSKRSAPASVEEWPAVALALEPYLRGHRFPASAIASVRALLEPERQPHYPPALVAQSLLEMQAEGRPFKASTLATWCAHLAAEPAAPTIRLVPRGSAGEALGRLAAEGRR